MSDALEDLIHQLREGNDSQRMAAIEALANLDDPRVAEMLMTVLLFDERGYVRYDAVLALAQNDPVRGAEFLKTILHDPTHTLKIRCRAMKALGHVGGADVIPVLEEIAANGRFVEADTATEALQHILKRTQNP